MDTVARAGERIKIFRWNIFSVVTVAEICNSVDGGAFFSIFTCHRSAGAGGEYQSVSSIGIVGFNVPLDTL